ncbi:SDR family NAD(P)-dependent oxidoreductase [Chondromyces crocatus]|uniref:Short-chain dehydrogenase n=1 Tax=Chondromyces crocatus TaxID=52 RepID=A0A0K1ELR8_CHOCO|nr:SDR family NAD(P)-dependent oxidoreductase [Chondromyces crocatus]AKT41771.1 short-chain dehydrogenase [Chondromyces crocatus]
MSASFKKAIVVGASSGIGEAIARRLADEGADVAIVARREDELKRVAASVPGGKIRPYAHDAADFEGVPALFERIVADLGGLDTLVYAAGAMPAIAEGEYSFEKDRTMVTVNLLGAMAWMNPAAARFQAAQSGTLVGISSIAGERGRRGNPGYCTSKAALSTYLESLRNRCSRYGVNVVTVKPGFVDTAMTRGMKGLFWLISADEAARQSLAMARRGSSASGFVPSRWALVALVVRMLPSFVFRKLNF